MFDVLIDAAMKRARENGDFDNLPGEGKPINPSSLTADPFAKVFGDGVMTPLGALQNQIDALHKELNNLTDSDACKAVQNQSRI